MAHAGDLQGRQFESYVDTGSDNSIEITLSGTPGTVTTVNIPDSAKGIKIYPRTNHIRFAVNATVAGVATSSTTPIATTDFAIGGIAKNDIWETRLLPTGVNRTVTLRSTTGSVVVDFEVF